ncbi:hypothetical protein OQJ13_05345 [Legionella sp. PATHC035]|uniref:hypothetical protein n=1 Tax=Legionella sp. PATHC035 TaxID=2992040 RepID=UPI00224387C1|nr:hypothetical protein [Legionella sp. PATHC035]MCW8408392.1 hypothetical protein [Legionella sp. PATHC035]
MVKKGKFYCLAILNMLAIIFSQNIDAACSLTHSSGQTIRRTEDVLGRLLLSDAPCPQNVFALRQLLKNSGVTLQTTLVANRGFHNPTLGSFSIFEMALGELKIHDAHWAIQGGDFFFGHFTAIGPGGDLIADQNSEKDSLMVEAFAWDSKKEVFNFYELRGDGSQGQWFYRGDSSDIFADNEWLHRQPDPKHPQFGNRLRCSGCHGAGGPIMKELIQPHNDWWEPMRQLDFGGHHPDTSLQEILETLVPPEQLAKNVLIGLQKLNQSKKMRSLQEQLRPLFCPVELNLMSDNYPNDKQHSSINIPVEFFLDARFLQAKGKQTIKISRTFYQTALNELGSHFPETDWNDADHAWLTPVKAESDQLAIDNLLQKGIIDLKFTMDVLDVDMTNPIFSSARCRLLRLVPTTATPNWLEVFKENLNQSADWAAKKLLKNLMSQQQDPAFYVQKAKKYLQQCRLKLQNSKNVLLLYRLLAQRRAEIRASEISLNPRGQILEPGFRIIFPENKISSTPERLKLTLSCEVIEDI